MSVCARARARYPLPMYLLRSVIQFPVMSSIVLCDTLWGCSVRVRFSGRLKIPGAYQWSVSEQKCIILNWNVREG